MALSSRKKNNDLKLLELISTQKTTKKETNLRGQNTTGPNRKDVSKGQTAAKGNEKNKTADTTNTRKVLLPTANKVSEVSKKGSPYTWTALSTKEVTNRDIKDKSRTPVTDYPNKADDSASVNLPQSGTISQGQIRDTSNTLSKRGQKDTKYNKVPCTKTFNVVHSQQEKNIGSTFYKNNKVTEANDQVLLQVNNNDVKGAAISFLKEKMGSRKVFVNKDHVLFKNNTLSTSSCTHLEKEQQELLPVKKRAAIDFLKKSDILRSETDLRDSETSAAASYRNKSNKLTVPGNKCKFKIDRRQVVGQKTESQLETCTSSSNSKALSRSPYKSISKTPYDHKLNRTTECSNPYVPAISKPDKMQSERISNSKFSPPSTPFVKLGKYKLVKTKKTTPSLGLDVSTSNSKGTMASMYKIVKISGGKKQTGQKCAQTPYTRVLKQQFVKPGCSRYKLVNNASDKDCRTNNINRETKFKSGSSVNISLLSASNNRTSSLSSPSTHNLKTRTRFKLVRKAVRTAHRKLSTPIGLNSQHTRNTKSQYKLVNSRNGQLSKRETLVWNNRFSLKRDNSQVLDIITVNQLLGRRVTNLSSNKYKFVNSANKQLNRRRPLSMLPAKVLERKFRRSKFKIDRRTPKSSGALTKSYRLETDKARVVMLGGILYKSSRSHFIKIAQEKKRSHVSLSRVSKSPVYFRNNLRRPQMRAVIVRGIKYEMDPSGHTLQRVSASALENEKKTIKRLDIGGVTYLQTRPGTLVKASTQVKRIIASRSVHKSIVRAAAVNKKSQKKYCMFYNRFGKCNRKDTCRFIHDPDKVAVCTRFLRGTCNVTDCPFSHKLAKEKMPVCLHYLRGACSRDQCPYRHIKVSEDAEICHDFLKGYCPEGKRCKKQHTLVCIEFIKTGSCPRGSKCKLRHPSKPSRKALPQKTNIKSDGNERLSKTNNKASDEVDTEDDRHLPLSKRNLPSYISLTSDETGDEISADVDISNHHQIKKAEQPLKIRPSFK